MRPTEVGDEFRACVGVCRRGPEIVSDLRHRKPRYLKAALTVITAGWAPNSAQTPIA